MLSGIGLVQRGLIVMHLVYQLLQLTTYLLYLLISLDILMQIMHRTIEKERKRKQKMSMSHFLFITLQKTGGIASQVNEFTVM